MSPEARERSFDDLARALAEGSISRRRALKLFAGTAIAALIPSRALAQQQKVTICHKPGTPDEETKEVSPSAVASHQRHGDQLGPCCLPNGGSCTAGSECCTGFCKGTSGQRTCVESCIPSSATPCDPLDPATWPATCGEGRICIREASGEGHCQIRSGGTGIPCTTSCDCPTGQFCVQFGGGNLCARSE